MSAADRIAHIADVLPPSGFAPTRDIMRAKPVANLNLGPHPPVGTPGEGFEGLAMCCSVRCVRSPPRRSMGRLMAADAIMAFMRDGIDSLKHLLEDSES